MKKSTYTLLSLLLLVGLYCAASVSYALDAPHNPVDGVDCDLCHYPTTVAPPDWATLPAPAGSTPVNQLCLSCHYTGSSQITNPDSKYEDVATHSSYETNPTATGADIFLIECRTCHNPHLQDQMRALPADGNLDFGTTTGITATVLTDSTKSWGINQLKDALLIPNTAYIQYSYRILSNTANTLTIFGTMRAVPYTGVGKPYRIKYGKLVKASVATPNSGAKVVTFLSNSGSLNSFASSTAAVKGVCQVCHTKTKYFLGDGTKLDGGHPASYDANCTVACHQHKYGFKAGGCNGCHGQSGSSGAPIIDTDLASPATGHTVGAHPKHAESLKIGCDVCHSGNGMPTVDQKITVAFSGYGTGGSYQGKALSNGYTYNSPPVTIGATESCSTVYCHSSGQSADGASATPVYATPNWEVPSSGTCGTCHKTTIGTTLGLIDTGSHTSHLTSPATMGCDACHTGVVADGTSYNSTNHVNKSIDASNAYTKAGAPGNGYGTCSAAACHGSGSPTWGNPTAKAGCYRCHGDSANGNSAPGPDTAGDTAATDPQVGAHQAHLKGSSNYSNPIACNECHTEPPFVQSAGHINDATPGVAEVLFGTLALTNPRSVAGSPTYAGGQCSNVYCHDGSRFKNGYAGGTGHTPLWSNTAYLGDVATAKAANCGTCHGNPPSNPHPNVTPNQCSGCHANVNSNGDGFIAKAEHVNGALEPTAGCNGCHGYSGSDGAPRVGTDMISTLPLGQHGTHVDAKGYGCDVCHSGHNMPGTIDSNIAISFTQLGTGGTYDPPAAWQTVPVTKWTYTPWSDGPNSQQCNNLYCHSSGQGATGNVATPVYSSTSPTWGGTAGCGSCHAITGMSTGGHTLHLTGDTNCGNCHTGASASAYISSNHVNKSIDVASAYTAGGTAGNGYGTCSAASCHANVYSTVGSAPTPTWGSTGNGCTACHSVAMASYGPNTGGHALHNDPTCTKCHNIGTAELSKPTTSHADGDIDIANVGYPANVTKHAAGSGYGTCSAASCHANVYSTVGSAPTPTWGSTGNGCAACHTAPNTIAASGPPTGSHSKHYTNNNVSVVCTACHNAGTTMSTKPTTSHTDGDIDIVNVGYTANKTKGSAFSTCATACHGATTRTWGQTSTGCNYCHPYTANDWATNNPTGTALAVEGFGAHAKHIAHLVSLGGVLTPSTDSFGSGASWTNVCGVCHNGASHTLDGTVGSRQISVQSGYQFGASAPLYSGVVGNSSSVNPKTCSNVSCHFQATPVWSAY